MIYRIEILPSAQKEIASLSGKLRRRIDGSIAALAENPRPTGCVAIKGYKSLYRIRVDDYRVIYRIRDDIILVTVAKVGHRREVYRRL